VIGKWILRVLIASLVVQLAILGIVAYWSFEVESTVHRISQFVDCTVGVAPAGCPSTPTPTPTPTPT
jgi:hypothetical protein